MGLKTVASKAHILGDVASKGYAFASKYAPGIIEKASNLDYNQLLQNTVTGIQTATQAVGAIRMAGAQLGNEFANFQNAFKRPLEAEEMGMPASKFQNTMNPMQAQGQMSLRTTAASSEVLQPMFNPNLSSGSNFPVNNGPFALSNSMNDIGKHAYDGSYMPARGESGMFNLGSSNRAFMASGGGSLGNDAQVGLYNPSAQPSISQRQRMIDQSFQDFFNSYR
jgi:hypothetical protein